MIQKLHKNAKTNYAIRQAIKSSREPISVLAANYHLSWATVNKWKQRESVEDYSSRPERLRTDLTQEQIERILFERKQFKKTLEDIFFTLEGDIPNLYPMKIYRVLARYGLSRLPDELINAERKIRKFRRYGIGYLHLDLLYAPKINGERRYIYTAIDRVAKLAFIMVGRRKTKKIHPFDKICQQHKIQHRTIRFKHPWTNGLVERFNRTLKDRVLKKYLIDFVNRYNFEKRLKSLNYKTPAQYLKEVKNISIQRIVI